MPVLIAAHMLCASAFGILICLVVVRREKSVIGDLFLIACLATVVWSVSAALGSVLPNDEILIAEDVRSIAWLVFLSSLLDPEQRTWQAVLVRGRFRLAVQSVALLAVGSDVYATATLSRLSQLEILSRIGIAVLGLFLVENLYRTTSADRRWHITPLAIAFGGICAFDLYLYSDTLLFRSLDPALLSARAIVDAAVVPLLALALARNKNWRMNIRVSRNAAFHGITLVASGVFLLSVAIVGTLFRRYGGDWSLVLQITLLFGSAIVLAVILTSASMRVCIRHVVLKNFFPYRYDYRVEWDRFIEALASPDEAEELPERIVRAIARIVASQGGVLFHRQDGLYVPIGRWKAQVDYAVHEPENSEFIRGFRAGEWIQIMAEGVTATRRPDWQGSFWLAVPLTHRGELIGFVVVTKPPGPFVLDWEIFDLLRTVGRQAASYLAEQNATQALTDARLLREYSKRFAFVIHDIKNLSSQLGLVVSNARRHGTDPEFLADAWLTIEHSVDRLNALLSQLRGRQGAPDSVTEAVTMLRSIAANHAARDRIDIACTASEAWVRIDGEGLRSALTHLVDNAVDASGPTGQVGIGLEFDDDGVVVSVSDEGFGMDPQFIRDKLFRPFRSTKDVGYGIGAFQTRELIHSAGGQLQVISRPGAGTTMRVTLTKAEAPDTKVA